MNRQTNFGEQKYFDVRNILVKHLFGEYEIFATNPVIKQTNDIFGYGVS